MVKTLIGFGLNVNKIEFKFQGDVYRVKFMFKVRIQMKQGQDSLNKIQKETK